MKLSTDVSADKVHIRQTFFRSLATFGTPDTTAGLKKHADTLNELAYGKRTIQPLSENSVKLIQETLASDTSPRALIPLVSEGRIGLLELAPVLDSPRTYGFNRAAEQKAIAIGFAKAAVDTLIGSLSFLEIKSKETGLSYDIGMRALSAIRKLNSEGKNLIKDIEEA